MKPGATPRTTHALAGKACGNLYLHNGVQVSGTFTGTGHPFSRAGAFDRSGAGWNLQSHRPESVESFTSEPSAAPTETREDPWSGCGLPPCRPDEARSPPSNKDPLSAHRRHLHHPVRSIGFFDPTEFRGDFYVISLLLDGDLTERIHVLRLQPDGFRRPKKASSSEMRIRSLLIGARLAPRLPLPVPPPLPELSRKLCPPKSASKKSLNPPPPPPPPCQRKEEPSPAPCCPNP